MASDQREKVRVAIVGVGNCASSLVQGVSYYQDARDAKEKIPGLMHTQLGGYFPGDIEFVAAFDVAASKVNKPLFEAIFAEPNNTIVLAKLGGNLPYTKVHKAPVMDGVGKYLAQRIEIAAAPTVDVREVLRDTQADVLVNYLPVGSEEATRFYAQCALDAGCAFVNCIPVFVSKDGGYCNLEFARRGLPLIGDDIKSQVGATITHRALAHLFAERGVRLDRTYQLNFGGNMDFYNMLERERLVSKKISKTNAVLAEAGEPLAPENIHVGPSDYVPWLTDRKIAHIVLEGTTFGDVPLKMEVKLEVWDSPNSAGVVIDAVRLAKCALNMGIGGNLAAASAYLMKSPAVQMTEAVAREELERFIAAANVR